MNRDTINWILKKLNLRMEMDEYRRLKRSLRVLKSYTDYEEDLYEEAV